MISPILVYVDACPAFRCRCCCKGLLSHSWELLSWPGLKVVCCCLAHSARPRFPMLRSAPQSCCGWRLLEQLCEVANAPSFQGLKVVGRVVCALQGPLLPGFVGAPWLLQLLLCWLGCTWGCWLVVSSVLLPQVFLLRLLVLHLWVL